jgi:twitching motility protein PilT
MTGLASIRLHDLLYLARKRNGSDLHLTAGLPPVLRVDGELEQLCDGELTPADLDEIASSLSAHGEACAAGTFEDRTMAWSDAELGTMRAHFFRAAGRPAAAIRLLGRTIPTLEALGAPPVVASFVDRAHGLILFAGPTGSGKSTTMASLVDRINATCARRIITIEDPIEYRYDNRRSVVSQREVGRDTPNIAMAVLSALRCDPDVIVVGEMRDADTMRAVLTAAETGHLVLATVHTADAAQTVDRIVDAFSGGPQVQVRAQLAQVLVAVVAQRLIRRSGGTGRRAAMEILIATDAVRNLLREAKVHHLKNAMATGRQSGMQTFEHHLAELLHDREVDERDAQRLQGV